MSASPEKKKASIYDKLTDPKQYTGAHKERFDSSGRGKGIDGRSTREQDTGYVRGFSNAKHLVGSSSSGSLKSNSGTTTSTKKATTTPTKSSSPEPLAVDTTKPPKVDEPEEAAPAPKKIVSTGSGSPPPKKTSSSTKISSGTKTTSGTTTKKKPSIYDKLTDPNAYTGAHKQRFDTDGHGKGKGGRVHDTGYVQGFGNAKHLT